MSSFPFLRVLLVLAALFACATAGRAQPAGEGVVRVVGWPSSSERPERLRDYDVLPFLDTLAIGYRFDVAAGQPRLSLALDWSPGAYGLLKGRRVAYRQLPRGLRLVALAFRADVYAGAERVSELVVTLDSMMLGERPDVARVDLDSLSWGGLFVETPADSARALLARGVELRHAEVLQAAFAVFDDEQPVAPGRPEVSARRAPTTVVVYEPDVVYHVFLSLDWLFRDVDYGYRPPEGDGRARGDRVGRGAVVSERRGRSRGDDAARETDSGRRSGRRGRSSGGDAGDRSGKASGDRGDRGGDDEDDDEDDEDDDNDLLPAALGAATAVAFVAYAGGTVGYFGNVAEAPIGLSAGFVRARWGMLLQAAVNESLLSGGDTPRHLLVKLFGFGGAGRSPLQPALGAGLLAVEEDDEVTLRPSLSLGAAALFGPLVLHAAYDVAQGGAEIGLALNFRANTPRRDP